MNTSVVQIRPKLGTILVTIKEAVVWDDNCEQTWVIRLLVENETQQVEGWGFMDPEYIELRFEKIESGEPPGFLAGVMPWISPEENSLFEFAHCSSILFVELQKILLMFLVSCTFSIVSLQEVSASISIKRAVSYKHHGIIYRISKHTEFSERVKLCPSR